MGSGEIKLKLQSLKLKGALGEFGGEEG